MQGCSPKNTQKFATIFTLRCHYLFAMIQNHLGKANCDNNNHKFLFDLPVVIEDEEGEKKCRHMRRKLRAESQIEVNFIIQSNKYQK